MKGGRGAGVCPGDPHPASRWVSHLRGAASWVPARGVPVPISSGTPQRAALGGSSPVAEDLPARSLPSFGAGATGQSVPQFPPCSRGEGGGQGGTAGSYPCGAAHPGGFFLLQTQSRAAAPGQALARTRRTANPSCWVSVGPGVREHPNPPAASLLRRHPFGRQLRPRAGRSRPQLWCPPSPGEPLPGTCSELGTASASAHSQPRAGAGSPGDSSCPGGPVVWLQPPALLALSAAGKLRHRALLGGLRQRDWLEWSCAGGGKRSKHS